ncbi:DNA-binding transcriptional regulator YbjK [Cryobacterium sp. MP_M5]|uniref:TetR/AcrR family transcriptional regulator n=1 Tax=unclassified Cryobacterium TaxID=2649013 RepID=UPI0018CB240C|nr:MULTISPECIES: TetR family transcriptional regulator [unclassified Cryobacterium]MBG6059149.1 DNA-binding transcriptional regulator YbjK [Cryobacterium sp. MP_M3]MEC5177443.1 DNA-binding transcriptional regulator YbjK [Cryobacterium sp. MP_M5]
MSLLSEGAAPRAPRRLDPQRRDRIIDACLQVIGEVGVAGTSHRRIATVADVSLGSMTYHFEGMDDLLRLSFARFADTVADTFYTRLSAAADVAAARQVVVDLIMHDVLGTDRELVLTHELYTLAARRPEYRSITESWMSRSRAALEQHFDPDTARILDALVEGLSIHRALDDKPMSEELAADAVQRVAPL